MFDDDVETTLEGEPAERSKWLSPLAWSVLSLLSLVVFEMTAEPTLSAVVLCSKFGWEDLQTGIWLRRTDPNAGRGAACFWFSLMVGVFRILMAGGGLSLAALVGFEVWVHAGLPGAAGAQKPVNWVRALFGVMIVAEVLVALLGLAGCVVARRHQVRVWISPMLHRARREGQWPPGDASAADRSNTGDRVLMPSIAIGVIAIAFGALILIFDARAPTIPVIAAALALAAVIVWLSRRVTATSFAECWPESVPSDSGGG